MTAAWPDFLAPDDSGDDGATERLKRQRDRAVLRVEIAVIYVTGIALICLAAWGLAALSQASLEIRIAGLLSTSGIVGAATALWRLRKNVSKQTKESSDG